jgi:hypothetical protein
LGLHNTCTLKTQLRNEPETTRGDGGDSVRGAGDSVKGIRAIDAEPRVGWKQVREKEDSPAEIQFSVLGRRAKKEDEMGNLRRACLLAVTLFITQAMSAQQSKPAPEVAPVPSAIAAARKVFISNAGTDDPSELFSGGPARCYNEFYRQIQALNRYELVSSPTDADIILEIRLLAPTAYAMDPVLRLRILDPKTRIVLWAFYGRAQGANLKRTYDRNLDIAIEKIVSDLKSIAGTAKLAKP